MHNQNIDTVRTVLSASNAGFVGRRSVRLFLSFSIFLTLYSPPRPAVHFLWSKLCRSHRCLCYLHLGCCTFLFMSPLWSVPEGFQFLSKPLPRSLGSAAQHEHSAPETRHWLAVYWSTLKPRALEEMVILGAPLTLCLAIRWRLMSFRELCFNIWKSTGMIKKTVLKFELENPS